MGGTFRVLGLVRIVLELFAGHAIPALLAPLNNVATGLHAREELFDDAPVTRIRGADEPVVTDLPALPELAVLGADGIAVGLGAQTGGLSGALNLLTMLITARDEQHLLAPQPLKPGQGIAGERRIGAAQMRPVVDVIERGGEGVGHRRDPTQRVRAWLAS